MFEFLFGKPQKSQAIDETNLKGAINSKNFTFWTDVIDFIKKGGNPNATDENGNTFLHRFPQWTSELVYHGVSLDNAGVKNNDGYIPLAKYARHNVYPMLIVATPKEHLNEVWPDGTTIMTEYLKGFNASIEGFEELLFAGTDLRTPNADGKTPLDILSQKFDYFDYVVCAFENGHDVSDMKIEHKKHWYSKETEQTPLLFGMMREVYDAQRVFSFINILSKSDLTQRDDNGNTLLHAWATDFDKAKNRGADLRKELFSVLATKISVNALNSNGETPLVSALKMGEYYASYMCHGSPHSYETTRKEFIALLMDKMDAKGINLADKDGMTALHYAAKEGFNNEVVALVRKGADVLAKNAEGKTPADMASNDLIGAYLQMVVEAGPQKVASQSVQRQVSDNQNTIG